MWHVTHFSFASVQVFAPNDAEWQAVQKLCLRVRPNVVLAEMLAQGCLAGLKGTKILLRVELPGQCKDPDAIAQCPCCFALLAGQLVKDSEIVLAQKLPDVIQRPCIGPELAQHFVEHVLEHAGRVMEVD